MRRPYAWVCHVCGVSNAAGMTHCAACRFPAVASAVEVDRALGKLPKPEPTEKVAMVLGPLLNVLLAIALMTAFLGALVAQFAWSMPWIAIGFLMAVGGTGAAYFISDYGKWNARTSRKSDPESPSASPATHDSRAQDN